MTDKSKAAKYFPPLIIAIMVGLIVALTMGYIVAISLSKTNDLWPVMIGSFLFTAIIVGFSLFTGSIKSEEMHDGDGKTKDFNEDLYRLKKWHK